MGTYHDIVIQEQRSNGEGDTWWSSVAWFAGGKQHDLSDALETAGGEPHDRTIDIGRLIEREYDAVTAYDATLWILAVGEADHVRPEARAALRALEAMMSEQDPPTFRVLWCMH